MYGQVGRLPFQKANNILLPELNITSLPENSFDKMKNGQMHWARPKISDTAYGQHILKN